MILEDVLAKQIKFTALALAQAGLVLATGSGASFVVAEKFAHALRTVGRRSFSISLGELLHGDIGALQQNDLLLIFSRSGKIINLSQIFQISRSRNFRVMVISEAAPLTETSIDDWIQLPRTLERDPFRVIPTESFLQQAKFCDSVLLDLIASTSESYVEVFTESHPDGGLGRAFSSSLSDYELPIPLTVQQEAIERESLMGLEKYLEESKVGAIGIVGPSGKFENVITDGDLRRLLLHESSGLGALDLRKWLKEKRPPIQQHISSTLGDTLRLLRTHSQINVLPIVDDRGNLVSIVHARQILSFVEVTE